MRDRSTQYLGLRLSSPFVVAASPLSRDLETPLLLEDCGAGALVMGSLFEEDVERDRQTQRRAMESGTTLPHQPRSEEYIERLYQLKRRLQMPVIPSLNCHSLAGWAEQARLFEQAGADAIELNVYFLPTKGTESATEVDRRTVEIVRSVCDAVQIPVAVKISPYHSSLILFTQQVVRAGARGLVLFNRFLQPDIDVENMCVRYTIPLSTRSDILLPLTWTAILRHRIHASIAATGGVHDALGAVKLIAAGADVVQVASVLLRRGTKHMLQLCSDFEHWMDEHSFPSVDALQGIMSYGACGRPEKLERSGYVAALGAWPHPGSPDVPGKEAI